MCGLQLVSFEAAVEAGLLTVFDILFEVSKSAASLCYLGALVLG